MTTSEELVADILEHYGIKGMKWGVRKERTAAEKKALAKNIAIGVGVLTVAAGTAYAVHTLHTKGHLDLSVIKNSSSASKAGKAAVEKVLEEPTTVGLASRGRDSGFRFVKDASLKEPYSVFESAGLMSGDNEIPRNTIRKLSGGAVAAVLDDPKGRADRAGRLIPHSILIPKSMASGISTIDDVRNTIWPLLEDAYAAIY